MSSMQLTLGPRLQAVMDQMQSVVALLHTARLQQQQHTAECIPVIDLGLANPRPLLPTLNGLLLGYPVVWLLPDAAAADRAASWLSSVPLLLYRITAKFHAVKVGGVASRMIGCLFTGHKHSCRVTCMPLVL